MKTLLSALLTLLLALPAQAREWYVSAPTNQPAGNDANPGTLQQPLATIQRAADQVGPGDVVYVRGGTYQGSCPNCQVAFLSRSGTASGWIVFKNYPGEQPLVRFSGYAGFAIKAGTSYVEINGFRIQGAAASQTLAQAQQQPSACQPGGGNYPGPINFDFNGAGITVNSPDNGGLAAPRSAPRSHHLRFLNNEVFECSGAGIATVQCDYVTIANNLVYNTSWRTIYGTSGISVYQSWNYDQAPGYHNIIQGNRCFGNRVYVPVYWYCRITDGNGIIIDDSRNTQNSSVLGAYTGRTLVANNLLVNNGGSGAHAYESEHVDFINNTAYLNAQSPENTGGELFAFSSNDVLFQNNILVAPANKAVNVDYQNTNVRYVNNLFFGGQNSPVAVLGTGAIQAPPEFSAAGPDWTTADFRLRASSPAVGAGLASGAPGTDLAGNPRPGPRGVSLGAYEVTSGTTSPAPVVSGGVYRLVARHSGKALDVDNNSSADQATVWQYTINNTAAQRWVVQLQSDGAYTLTHDGTNKCLDVAGNGSANGNVVWQYTANGTDAQRWLLTPTDNGYYKLVHKGTTKCLDVNGGPAATADGVKVQQWEYTGGTNQQWRFERLDATRPSAAAPPAAPETALAAGSAYPNPTRGELTVPLDPAAGPATAQLRNAAGQVVGPAAHGTGPTLRLNVQSLPAGVYLLQVRQGSSIRTQRIAVQP